MHGYTQQQLRFWVNFLFQLAVWSITYCFEVVLWHLEELSMPAVGSTLTRWRDIFWLGSFIFKTRRFPTNYLEVIVQFSVAIDFVIVYWLSSFALCRIQIGKHSVDIASRFQRYESLFILIHLIIAITLHPSDDLLLLRNESYRWCSPRQERSNWAVRYFATTVVRSNLLLRGRDSTFDLVFAPHCSRNFVSEWNNVVILVKHDQWCPSPIRLWHGFNIEFVGVWLWKLISICLHGPLLVCNHWFDQALIGDFVGWNLVWFDLV